MAHEDQGNTARQRGGELGKLAGKLVKNAGPRTKQFIEETRPKIEKAVEDAQPRIQKAIDDAQPRIQKAVEDYRPRVEQAGRDAVKYAQEHQDEIAGLAMKGARMRMGPLAMALDALGVGAPKPSRPATTPGTCPSCATVNAANARFCAQCGAQLIGSEDSAAGQPDCNQPA